MSITFWAPQAPETTEEYECICVGAYEDGQPADTCGLCKGTGVEEIRESEGELNLANGNAHAFIQAMGLHYLPECDEYCGTIRPEELSGAINRLLRSLNGRSAVATHEPSQENNIVYCGRSQEYVDMRHEQLLSLLTEARKNGWEVVYG